MVPWEMALPLLLILVAIWATPALVVGDRYQCYTGYGVSVCLVQP